VVTTTTITQVTSKDIADRAERGYQLYLTRRAMITHEGGDTYTVPSCTGSDTYTVHYGGDDVADESCTCTDYGVHRGELSCKHLVAIAVMHASRRAGVGTKKGGNVHAQLHGTT
jgi:hypothetical protein